MKTVFVSYNASFLLTKLNSQLSNCSLFRVANNLMQKWRQIQILFSFEQITMSFLISRFVLASISLWKSCLDVFPPRSRLKSTRLTANIKGNEIVQSRDISTNLVNCLAPATPPHAAIKLIYCKLLF